MEELLIVNGSPRGPGSNSEKYSQLFLQYWGTRAAGYRVTAKKHREICATVGGYQNLLLIFPLYADGLPVTLLYFLKELEKHAFSHKPTVHVVINCGFLEPEQNRVAVDMVRLFCRENGYPFGSVLCVGAGEAILETPFIFLVKRKLKKLAGAIRKRKVTAMMVTMPLSKKLFIKASTQFWLARGEKNQLTRDQMAALQIERNK
ncbi:MAG TPA: hypothetical protein IAA58_10750 [Candidatus Gallacutalibacter stercoravium]|nr:hypothetical protein [Candidatus Gallacutalibacter stercoravium]